jgi:hypothetical protein
VVDEQRNIACSFAKRRKQDGKNVQPIIQVHAESPFCYHLFKILICRGYYPHIDSSRLRTSESFELLLLNHAQELRLKLDRQFANFIEEKRTAIGGLKATYSMCQGSSKGASLMSKEFALDQRSGNGPTKEVWVTVPGDKSVRILDSQTLSQKEKLTFEGQPEGYAVDAKRGRLYMNYEDKDLTTAIDLKTRKTVAKWQPSCGKEGPHGLSVDQDTGYLFVACSTQAEVLDAGHNGEKLSSIDTGDGVDDLNYSPATHTLYVGAAKDKQLTVARVDATGKLSAVAVVPTHEGARNGVVAKDGTVYLAHSQLGQLAGLVVVSPSKN